MLVDFGIFLGVVVLLTIAPGPDSALVMRQTLVHGRRGLWTTIGGIQAGLAVHVLLCVTGLSMLIAASDVLYDIVRYTGAAWLCLLGVLGIIAACRATAAARSRDTLDTIDARSASSRRLFITAFMSNLLNIKIVLFYIAFLPQFAPSGAAFVPVALLLAGVQMLVAVAWMFLVGVVVDRTRNAVNANQRIRRAIDAVTGSALVAFGVRLAAAAG